METNLKRIGMIAALSIALAAIALLGRSNPQLVIGAAVAYVVMVIAVWMVGKGKYRLVVVGPEQLRADARRLIEQLIKSFPEPMLEGIASEAKKTIVQKLNEVNDGAMEDARRAAMLLPVIQPKQFASIRQPALAASTLASYYLLADFQDNEVADDTKALIDNFIVGVKDKNL